MSPGKREVNAKCLQFRKGEGTTLERVEVFEETANSTQRGAMLERVEVACAGAQTFHRGHTNDVLCLAVHPAGSLAATGQVHIRHSFQIF
jgi:hypothetical protein